MQHVFLIKTSDSLCHYFFIHFLVGNPLSVIQRPNIIVWKSAPPSSHFLAYHPSFSYSNLIGKQCVLFPECASCLPVSVVYEMQPEKPFYFFHIGLLKLLQFFQYQLRWMVPPGSFTWSFYLCFSNWVSHKTNLDLLLSGEPQNKNSTLCAPRSHTVKLSVNVCSVQQFLNHGVLSPTQNNNWHPREQAVKTVSMLHCVPDSHILIYLSSELIYINHLINVEKDKND